MTRSKWLLALALSAGVLAGCGGATTTTTRTVTTAVRSATTNSPAQTTAAAVPTLRQSLVAFARCMRANGVSDFPDPTSQGDFTVSPDANPDSPSFQAAHAKCQRYLPSGLVGPGGHTSPTGKTMAKLVRIAECMRKHGVSQFPDPRTSVPRNPAGYQEITNFDGAILLFPSTLNLQAPAYRHALSACGAPPLGLPH